MKYFALIVVALMLIAVPAFAGGPHHNPNPTYSLGATSFASSIVAGNSTAGAWNESYAFVGVTGSVGSHNGLEVFNGTGSNGSSYTTGIGMAMATGSGSATINLRSGHGPH
jgi:hypothetical protein